jgi:integrase
LHGGRGSPSLVGRGIANPMSARTRGFKSHSPRSFRVVGLGSREEQHPEHIQSVKLAADLQLGLDHLNIQNGKSPTVAQEVVAVSQKHTSKIAAVTVTLEPSYKKMLEKIPSDNASIICDFIQAEINENNIKDSTKQWKIKVLVYLSRFLQHKSFNEMTKDDILAFLSTMRKTEAADPQHKWVGTYNNRVLVYSKFFRWLYNPDEPDHKKRITPPCMKGVKHLPRKEKSTYKPSDMRTAAEYAVFMKYCPDKRDKCYIGMDKDTSARPHELLKLNIQDIQFKLEPSNGRQYAEITVSGKTGERTLPLIDSLPYVKEWLAVHPEAGNPKAPLFFSQNVRVAGRRLTQDGIWYKLDYYKKKYFPRLLLRPDIPEEDKKVIKGMLQKPWNPYVFRHSALTEKAPILTESNLRNHAGWTMTSKMPAVYLHFFGAESSKALLEASGVIPKDRQQENLQNKICPNCNEPNTPHAKFCNNCKWVLTYDEYDDAKEGLQRIIGREGKLEKEVESLKEMLQKLLADKFPDDKYGDNYWDSIAESPT